MKPLAITASTLATACGVGWTEFGEALVAGKSGLRRNDFAPAAMLETYVGRVDGVERHSLPAEHAAFDCRAMRLAHVALLQDDFAPAVDRAHRRYGARRIGVFVGTSTSGMLATESEVRVAAQSGRDPAFPAGFYADRHCMDAPARFVRAHLGLRGITQAISTACSSSAKVFGAAARAIEAGFCDAAVVGGVDSLALSTLHGFRALGLLSAHACRPCDVARDGISIGEAAGFALLERDGDAPVRLAGVGESADAWHMSTPHPEGAGALRAMRAALAAAGLDPASIGYVNLHGTGTVVNDVAEDKAVMAALPHRPPVSSTKGYTGHALGAAGIVEVLVTAFALARQWIPRTLGCARVDPAIAARVAIASTDAALEHAISNSFGFGGNNCSIVLSRQP
jgi:3-oxoacyl-[acyl-carrier-protein] synthase-1